VAYSEPIPLHIPPERIVDIDIYRIPGVELDLHLGWKQIQDESPFSLLWSPRNGGHWIVTRGADIARIYADHENYSSNITIVPRKWGEMFPLRPTTLDPPLHRPLRMPINAALTAKAVRSVEPWLRKRAAVAVERVLPQGRCEFVADVAEPIPLELFMHLADLPLESARSLPRYGEEPVETEAPIMTRYADFLRPFVAQRQSQPGDDLLSRLATSDVNGRRISEDEAVDVASAVLTGGLDTVVSSLAIFMLFLARHPAHRRRLVADPSVTRQAVGELLRRFPIMTKARLLKHDQVIDGVRLHAGDMIVLPPLHGLDERAFDDPMTVDFDRPAASNSTFGNGVHRCPGSFLAQTELSILIQEWLARIPNFETEPLAPPKMRGGILGTVLELELRWPTSSPHPIGTQTPAGV